LRMERGLRQSDVADAVGIVKGAISMYETGQRTPSFEVVEAIADYFNVPMAFLLDSPVPKDRTNPQATPPGFLPINKCRVRLAGNIAAGVPVLAVEEYDTAIALANGIKCDFALKVTGDSMINARIQDGDIVFIRSQPDVEDGEIAAVIIDDEATLKRVYHFPGGVKLIAENPKYPPMTFTKENSDSIRIVGKAVAFQSYL